MNTSQNQIRSSVALLLPLLTGSAFAQEQSRTTQSFNHKNYNIPGAQESSQEPQAKRPSWRGKKTEPIIPRYAEEPGDPMGGAFAITKNFITGEEKQIPLITSGLAPYGFVSGQTMIDEASEYLDPNFGGLFEENSDAFPFTAQMKLFIWESEVDVNPGGCSATLIDAMHAITAGHCVHEGEDGDWVWGIDAVPLHDGDSDAFGEARMVSALTYNGWINNSYKNFDQAIIRLDRPVGMLTSWLSYGYNAELTWWYNDPFFAQGYPGDNYAGAPDQLYATTGNWDWSGAFRARANVNWPASVAGMSGSGAYTWVGGERVVMGDLAYEKEEDDGTISKIIAVKFNAGRFEATQNFIDDGYPNELDLVVLDADADAEGGEVNHGDFLSGFEYLVANMSHANTEFLSQVDVSVYLSTDDNINPAEDTLLQAHSFTHELQGHLVIDGLDNWMEVSVMPSPQIPYGTLSGTYWVGVVLDTPDANNSNNTTTGWDAVEIYVNGPEWPHLPDDFADISDKFSENFDTIAGNMPLPDHMAINRLDMTTRADSDNAFLNIGQLDACHNPYSGNYCLEMGSSNGGHQVANGLIFGLNGNGQDELELSFMLNHYMDSLENFDGVYIGAPETSGLPIVFWTPVWEPWQQVGVQSGWVPVENVDLHNHGVDVSGDFYLLFAQEGYLEIPMGGVAVDDICIEPPTPSITGGGYIPEGIGLVEMSHASSGGDGLLFISAAGPGPSSTPWGLASVGDPYTTVGPVRLDSRGYAKFHFVVSWGGGTQLWFHALDLRTNRWTNTFSDIVEQ